MRPAAFVIKEGLFGHLCSVSGNLAEEILGLLPRVLVAEHVRTHNL